MDDAVLAGLFGEFDGDAETVGEASVGCELADAFPVVDFAESGFGHEAGVGHP
nr:MAG: hypothetical protein [Bacteriophage sp.]